MTVDRRFIGWGVFFILAGAVPLLARQDVLDAELAGRATSIWPLLIVAIGLGVLLRDTTLDWVGGLLTAGTAGILVGGLLTSGFVGPGICSDATRGRPVTVDRGDLAGTGSFRVDVPCGDLIVGTREGRAWSLASTATDGRAPRVSASGDAIRIDAAPLSGFFLDRVGSRASWQLEIPTAPTIDLTVSINAGAADLDLSSATLGALEVGVNAGSARIQAQRAAALATLRVEVNAGEARVSLPSASLTGRLEANAGSLVLCVPPDVPLRLRLDDNVSVSNDFAARGLTRSGDTWERPGSVASTALVELDIEANAASIALDPEEGC